MARVLGLVLVLAVSVVPPASAQSLRGSSSSLDRQSRQAREHDFTYVRRPVQVRQLVSAGALVPVAGNRNYTLKGVSFEVARPEVKLFIERMSSQYRRTCGEPLVVTSLTRPTSLQPLNASRRSVHPTGMAIDLRRPGTARCRAWLESTLLALETRGVLEATLERSPPHYHVALFPEEYAAYVARPQARARRAGPSEPVEVPQRPAATARPAPGTNQPASSSHVVQTQETLWRIAQRHGTTVGALQAANGLTSTDIRVGQTLRIVDSPR